MSDELILEFEDEYIGSAVSPTVDITETTDDITVTITDFRGEHAYTVDKTDQAIADAEQAASNANTAAASATQAAQSANTAAGTANTAAQNADTKAALADSKAALAQSAATAANQAAEAAEAAKTAANTAAGNATTAAQNADAKAALADTATANADTATQAANTATTAANNAAQAANNAADVAIEAAETITDGYFPHMLAGAAESLMGETDTATFAERVSTHDGVARIEAIQGNTVVWNQLYVIPFNITQTEKGVTVTRSTDGTITLNGTATERGAVGGVAVANVQNHKYLIHGHSDSTDAYLSSQSYGADSNNTGTIITNNSANANWYYVANVKNGVTYDNFKLRPQVFDLTAMFGAGNEPATVAEFEAMFPDDYYPYNAGELLSVNIEGVNDREIPVSTYFPDGMKSAGSIHDELTMGKAVKRVDLRAYQSGDESDATVITDGTSTCYALSTPTETPIDPLLTMTYTVEQGGTEQIVIPTGENSAAPTMAIVYGLTADGVVDKALSVIAPIEGATASTNYSVNAYLVHDQQLYRVTSAIATGETIAPGTNCTATTVMAELVALTS